MLSANGFKALIRTGAIDPIPLQANLSKARSILTDFEFALINKAIASVAAESQVTDAEQFITEATQAADKATQALYDHRKFAEALTAELKTCVGRTQVLRRNLSDAKLLAADPEELEALRKAFGENTVKVKQLEDQLEVLQAETPVLQEQELKAQQQLHQARGKLNSLRHAMAQE